MTPALLSALQAIAIAHATPRRKDVGPEQPVELGYPSAPSHTVASALYPVDGQWVYLTLAASDRKINPSSALPRDDAAARDLSACASNLQLHPFFVAYLDKDATWKVPDSAPPTTKCLAEFLDTHVHLRGTGWSTLSRFEAHPESAELISDVHGVDVLRGDGATPPNAAGTLAPRPDAHSEATHLAVHAMIGTPSVGSAGMVEGFVDFLSLETDAAYQPGTDGWMSAIAQLVHALGPQLVIHAFVLSDPTAVERMAAYVRQTIGPDAVSAAANYYRAALERQGRAPDVAFAGSDPWTILMQLSLHAPSDYETTGGTAAILLGAR